MALSLGVVLSARLWAFPEASRQTRVACVACHANPAGGAELTDAGKAYAAKKKTPIEPTGRKAEYVGSDRCRMCHLGQHQSWSETPHARALTNLSAADSVAVATMAAKLKVRLERSAAETEACVRCHVTGFHLAGGYPTADSARAVSLARVGCESCHGPGSLHVYATLAEKKKVIDGAPNSRLCVQCHTAQTSPGFDFEHMVLRGAHPKKEG